MSGSSVVIEGELFHHIRGVCRFGVGDRFEVLAGDDSARLVVIESMEKHRLLARIESTRPLEALRRPWIHLALSVPKFNKVDLIVEKAAELGVHTLHLFVSDYSFVRQTKDVSASKMERWQKINISAAQQSGRGTLMNLEQVRTLADLLSQFKTRKVPGLFPYEGEARLSWKAAIAGVDLENQSEVWVFVGSEGGFSLREVELFREFGLSSLSMGSQILRVETACVAMVSVLKYELGV